MTMSSADMEPRADRPKRRVFTNEYKLAILAEYVFNGPGGAEISGEIYDPWESSPTATRTINGTTVNARFTNVGTHWSRTVLDGCRGDRITRVASSFDTHGMPVAINDLGEDGVAGDEQCTLLTYTPRNTTAWLTKHVHREQHFAVDCASAADPGALDDNDVITDVRYWFDGNSYGTAPSRGLPTRRELMSAWNSGLPTYVTVAQSAYDAHGRLTQHQDALGRPTATAYTPASGGPLVSTTVTNALGHQTSTTLDPAYGLPTRSVDPNGKETHLAYDPLGRLTDVWRPGRNPQTETADFKFAYGIRQNNVSFVTSQQLNPAGNYVTSHTLFDGLLRQVQTQEPWPVAAS